MRSSGPDGFEAWCVAIAAGFINFVMAGLGRMSGILYVVLIETFAVDRMEASVPFSARSLTRNLLGPVVGIIGQKYGVRAATLWGGIIGTISAAGCFYSPNMLWITILWGVLNGIGTALSITLPQVVLAMHFKKHKTTASGISVSGGCVGSFMFPALLEFLIWTYGLGGTFLILSGIIMNVIPAAMILNEPSWTRKQPANQKSPQITVSIAEGRDLDSTPKSGTESGSFEFRSSEPAGYANPALECNDEELSHGFNNIEAAARRSDRRKINVEILQENKSRILRMMIKYYVQKNGLRESKNKLLFIEDNIYRQMEAWLDNLERSLSGSRRSSFSSTKENSSGTESTKSVEEAAPDRYQLNNKNYVNKSRNDAMFLKVPEIKTDRRPNDFRVLLNHMLSEDKNLLSSLFPDELDIALLDQVRLVSSINTEKDFPILPVATNETKLPSSSAKNNSRISPTSESNSFLTHVKTAFKLHTNPLFLLVSLSRSVHFISFVPAVTIIVDFAMDKCLPVEDGKFVIAALSAGDLLGRLCLGWVTDRGYLSLPRYLLIVMILQGACTASLGILQSKVMLLTGITLFGLLQGSLFARHPVLVTKYLRKNEQSVAMGCVNFFSGCIGFTFPNYIGYFRDTLGYYNGIFYINGAIGALVGLMWTLEPFLWKRWKPVGDNG